MATKDRGIVAITGANGTIGYAAVVYALQLGYQVRCIVRREDAITIIKAGPSLRQYQDHFDFAVVPDNTVSGAYDSALAGSKYVVHIAGVWPKPHYHPDNDIYYPFVKSMENILSAAKKAGSVRRVVFTQAGASLVNPEDGDTLGTAMNKVLDEHVLVNAQSASFRPPLATAHHAYCGAKACCMVYLRSLQASGELPFSIVQVIPGTVIGPSELITTPTEASAGMDRMSRALLFNDLKPRYAFGFVSVQDCAMVHIEALDEVKVTSGDLEGLNWFIAAAPSVKGKNGSEIWAEASDAIGKEFEEEVKSGFFAVGRDSVPTNMPYYVESRLTEEKLLGGQKFRVLPDCVKEVGRWYVELAKDSSK